MAQQTESCNIRHRMYTRKMSKILSDTIYRNKCFNKFRLLFLVQLTSFHRRTQYARTQRFCKNQNIACKSRMVRLYMFFVNHAIDRQTKDWFRIFDRMTTANCYAHTCANLPCTAQHLSCNFVG